MTVTDRTDATEQEFAARIAPFDAAPTPPEVREAAVVEEVARALHKEDPTGAACSWPCPSRPDIYRRLAAAAVAAYRATQDGER